MNVIEAAVFNLNHPAHTVDWEFIHLSLANVVVIALMFVVFFLAAARACGSRARSCSWSPCPAR